MCLYSWPVVAGQFDDCHFSTGKILLVGEVLIASEKNLEPCGLSGPKQLTICGSIPTHRVCGADQMPAKVAPQFPRDILVEQDVHPADFVAIRWFA
jgi:hypothetical protein